MTEFSHCPDCSAPLGKDRLKCRCGWAAPAVQAQVQDPKHIPCADDLNCRKPGRLWFSGMPMRSRVCVEHAIVRYSRGERDQVVVP